MDLFVQALGWMSALAGAAVAAFGAGILVTGKAPARTRRAFRRVADAGMNALFTGSGLVLLTVASRADRLGDAIQLSALAAAMVLFLVGFIKYRPRGDANHQH